MTALPNAISPLFAAAAAVGQRSAGADPQLATILNYNAQLRQNAAQNDLEAQKLQMGYNAVSRPMGSSATSAGYFTMKNPVSDSVVAAKQLARSTTLAGVDLTDEQQAQLDTLEKDPNLSVNEYQDITHRIAASNQGQRQQESQDATHRAKWQYAHSLSTQINDQTDPDQSIRNQVRAWLSDPKMTANEMRVGIQSLMATKQTQAKQDYAEKVKNQQTQLALQKPEVREARKALEAYGPEVAGMADAPAEQLVQALATGKIPAEAKQAVLQYRQLKAGLSQTAIPVSAQAQAAQQPPAPAATRQSPPKPGPGQVLIRDKQTGKMALLDKATGKILQEIE